MDMDMDLKFRLIGMDKKFHDRFKHSYTTNVNNEYTSNIVALYCLLLVLITLYFCFWF